MATANLCGFNLSLQSVDQRYTWINKMIDLRFMIDKLYGELLEILQNDDTSNAVKHTCDLCDAILDYVSRGHFEIYPKILELVENASGRSFSIARRAMPTIEQTSDYLMRFNDFYNIESNELIPLLPKLGKDLIALKKCLETRFRNEDRLIIGLKLVHAAIETPTLTKA